jgi:hypothetical protein
VLFALLLHDAVLRRRFTFCFALLFVAFSRFRLLALYTVLFRDVRVALSPCSVV